MKLEWKSCFRLGFSIFLLYLCVTYWPAFAGFAGTLLAFVPNDMLESFRENMERMLGAGSVHVLSICPQGGIRIE